MNAEEFLTPQEEKDIILAIQKAEASTSGEIRVHIENTSYEECMKRAEEVFYLLNMDKTKDANGVLFYVSAVKQKFSILGDVGIDKVVPSNFWESIKDTVIEQFSQGNYVGGLILGIEETGKKLKEFFPFQEDDKNELSDEISKS